METTGGALEDEHAARCGFALTRATLYRRMSCALGGGGGGVGCICFAFACCSTLLAVLNPEYMCIYIYNIHVCHGIDNLQRYLKDFGPGISDSGFGLICEELMFNTQFRG